MRTRLYSVCFLKIMAILFGLFGHHVRAESLSLPIIPRPAKVEMGRGTFEITDRTSVVSGPGTEAEAEALAQAMRAPTGFALPVGPADSATNCIALELKPALGATLGSEGYTLSVRSSRVVIHAASTTGLFYGGVTLRQLLPPEIFSSTATRPIAEPAASEGEKVGQSQPQSGGWKVPCLELEDAPRFVWRGLLIDVARHYMPVEFLKKAVDLVALHKMNTLQLHLTDDQGWRLEIAKYPRLTEVGSIRKESPVRGDRDRGDGQPYGPYFYTQAQMRELIAYAQSRHVTVVPEIEMPGHFLAALAAYPEYSCQGGPFNVRTRWGVEPDILCPGNENSFAFVQDILAEVIALFPSRFIHIGGDEAPRERWKHCPKCQARVRAEGLRNEAELQTYFNRRIEAFLVSKGRRLIGWDEILEGGLTPGAAVMSWRGTVGGLAAANADHDVVMSPTSHCYFDYAQSREPGEPESIGGYIPLRTVYAFEPIPLELPEAKQSRILGTQGNIWTEYLHTPRDVEYFAFPRAAALAEVVWSPKATRDYKDFCQRLEQHQKRLDQWQVNYRKLDAASRDKP